MEAEELMEVKEEQGHRIEDPTRRWNSVKKLLQAHNTSGKRPGLMDPEGLEEIRSRRVEALEVELSGSPVRK